MLGGRTVRAALLFLTGTVVAAAGFAFLRSGEAPPQSAEATHPGAPLFARHCASCHTPTDIAASLKRGGPDLDANAAALERFLATHGAADAAQDRLIVAYLRSLL
ncbi:MAG: cytochrome c [Steroidobacteraceae bacterium]|nr:cytochrome c [Steroidobacteraceae bacterium]MDW8259593.1 cytochrome c [Gammaproteobacteria bacterium]